MTSARTVHEDAMEEGRDSGCIPRSRSPRITLMQKFGAEALGTFFLVFAGCGSEVVNNKTRGQVTLVGTSLTWGSVVVALVYALGHLSGCHVNPAVSIALASVSKFQWALVPGYILAQCLGSICAAFALRVSLGSHFKLGATYPIGGTDAEALALEFIITFILMFVIMSVCTDEKAVPQLGGATIGAIVTANALIATPISGASMNPARSLGPALVSNFYRGFWVYIIGPTLGALAGAWAYQLLRIHPDTESTETKGKF